MSTIHFIDTTVLSNLLQIPRKSDQYETVKKEYEKYYKQGDSFVFPIAVLVETGNHISHIDDGNLRRQVANRFTEMMTLACHQEKRMSVVPEISVGELLDILVEFPENALQKTGFGDLSIKRQYEEYWSTRQPIGHMRIWSLDHHLMSHPEHEGGLSRRKNK